MKEHEKSFCRARVAVEEGRKPILAVSKDRGAESESNSGEQSPASVSPPPPSATAEAVSVFLKKKFF